jgi:hypothetical protein
MNKETTQAKLNTIAEDYAKGLITKMQMLRAMIALIDATTDEYVRQSKVYREEREKEGNYSQYEKARDELMMLERIETFESGLHLYL